MKKPMSVGQTLVKSCLAEQTEVFRGDVVTLVVDAGGFRIETSAVAQSDSRVGQSIRVRPEQGTGTVMARVVSPGVVRMGGE
jgi:flagella basal body P-ring formation protein FlgA